ncbi:glycosyltransferase [Gilvimarinus xylanilyticus]|uniref:Glycosyltransferase n=1 Tax=Gilvimarinus xylanilyticus TaxID=2944139 RepID=A0A9X2I056_9GAMM|nr:glycosyltransferase [Gilvimarinus xylanilyticus]MCP8900279.1 glycosyltransferase [Gilvimarinus xylanilyticus]
MHDSGGRLAIVLHIFYLDIAERLLGQLRWLASDDRFELWVTVSAEKRTDVQTLLARHGLVAHVRDCPNIGMDIVPFLQVLPELAERGFTTVIKLHTKRGSGKASAIWGRALSDTVTDLRWSDYAYAQLNLNRSLDMVGVGPYFCSGRRLMLENETAFDFLLTEFPHLKPLPNDWGFFIGTMFAARIERLLPLARWATNNRALFNASYHSDGQLVHAVEGILALFCRRSLPSIGLIHNAGVYAIETVSVTQGVNQALSRQLSRELSNYKENSRLLMESQLLEEKNYPFQGVVKGKVDLYRHYLLVGQFDKRVAASEAWSLKTHNRKHLTWERAVTKSREPGSVSVIVPVFNQPDLTAACIRSLYQELSDRSFTVTVVDNGSDDKTQSTLKSLAREYPLLKIVKNKKNLNFALGCNIGFCESSGEYAVFLNNDTKVTPGWLSALLGPVEAGEAFASQPLLLYPDGTVQCMGVVFSTGSSLGYPIYAGLKPEECHAYKPRQFQAVTAACVCVKATDFAELEGFDPLYINGQEDIDLCLRLGNKTGLKAAYVPDSRVIHYESKSKGRGRYIEQNRRVFVHKWGGKVKADDQQYYLEDGFSVLDWQPDNPEREQSLRVYRPMLDSLKPKHSGNLPKYLQRGNEALGEDARTAAACYINAVKLSQGQLAGFSLIFERLRETWLEKRSSRTFTVGVCSWELSHNPAGRALTLAESYPNNAEVEILGCILPSFGSEVWPPVNDSRISCHSFTVINEAEFVLQALSFVARHPVDLLHLSKPRIHNIIIGWLYQLMWGAKVIVDVDDEELAIVKADAPIKPTDYIAEHGQLPPLKNLHKRVWTQLAAAMVDDFDGITVANGALQTKYGGAIVPHVRPASRYQPSAKLKEEARQRFGIPENALVAIFVGTPRRHKGIFEAAKALSALKQENVYYLIVGGEVEQSLYKELKQLPSLNCVFAGNQAYDSVASVVAAGDITILLQDADSAIAQYQTPAKLTDALAMGVTVFAQPTPGMQEWVDNGAVIPVTRQTLLVELKKFMAGHYAEQGAKGRLIFERQLTTDSVAPVIQDCLNLDMKLTASKRKWHGQIEQIFDKKGLPLGFGE